MESASLRAFTQAISGAPPPSPIPRVPSGVNSDGVIIESTSKLGSSRAVGAQ